MEWSCFSLQKCLITGSPFLMLELCKFISSVKHLLFDCHVPRRRQLKTCPQHLVNEIVQAINTMLSIYEPKSKKNPPKHWYIFVEIFFIPPQSANRNSQWKILYFCLDITHFWCIIFSIYYGQLLSFLLAIPTGRSTCKRLGRASICAISRALNLTATGVLPVIYLPFKFVYPKITMNDIPAPQKCSQNISISSWWLAAVTPPR